MTAKTLLLIFGLSGLAVLSNAQAVSDVVYEGRQRYGLKMGMGMSSMYGGKLLNPRPSIGVLAGFYFVRC